MGFFNRKRRDDDEAGAAPDRRCTPPPSRWSRASASTSTSSTPSTPTSRPTSASPSWAARQGGPDAIDMYVMAPTEDRPRATVITSGMSRLPMQGAPENFERTEPPPLPAARLATRDERPRGRAPLVAVPPAAEPLAHAPRTPLVAGHRPHGPARRSPQSYADNTSLCGALLLRPFWVPDGFRTLEATTTPCSSSASSSCTARASSTSSTTARRTSSPARRGRSDRLVDITRPSAV